MQPRLLRLFALRPVRRRPLRALLAIVAVAAGTSMAVSVFIVRSSVDESVRDFGRDLSGPTELRVVGGTRRGGLEPGVVDKVTRTEGVGAAVPVVQTVAVVETSKDGGGGPIDPSDKNEQPVLALGVDCRAQAIAGNFGCTDDLVADHGDRPLGVGPGISQDGQVRTNTGTVPLAGVPVFEGLQGLDGGQFVVFALPTAQRVFDRDGRLDAIYVQPDESTSRPDLRHRLEQVIGENNAVLTAAEGPPEVDAALDNVLPLFTLMALLALATGGMLVYNTVTLSLEERRRELAVLGALGGTSRVLGMTALSEAGILGAIGGVIGAAGGLAVAGPIIASLSHFTERTGGIPLALHVGFRSLAVGAALGIVVALLAALAPIRRALRIDVVSELSARGLRSEATARRVLLRSLGFAGIVASGLVMCWVGQRNGGLEKWQVPLAGAGFAVAAVGMLLSGSTLAPLGLRPLQRLVENWAPGRLAVANLTRAPGRTGVMVAAVGAAVTTAFVTAGYTNSVRVAITDHVNDNMDGVQVSSVGQGANINLDAGLSDDVLSALRDIEGVDEVHRGAHVLVGAKPGDLMQVSAFDDSWQVDDDGEEQVRGHIDIAAFKAGAAVINTTLARDTGLRPGDSLRLPAPQGMVDVPVMAVTASGGATGRSVEISWDLHQEIFGQQPSRSVSVTSDPGVSQMDLARRIRESELGGRVDVQTPGDVVDEANESVAGQMAPFWTLQRGLLAVSFVAVLSTLLLVGVQRRREMGTLAAVGTAPSTLRQMVMTEAAAVGVGAIMLGAVGGLIMLWALLYVAPLLIGWATPFRPDWLSVPLWGGVGVVVAVLASLWPARRAARTDVIVALRSE